MSASELQKAIDKLVKKEPGWKSFITPPAVGGRAGGKSTGRPSATSASGTPFAESDYTLRQHWPERTLTSPDGFFVFSYKPIKLIALENGATATFKEPTP